MTTSISIPDDLAERVREIAEREHRTFSGQVSFFLSEGVRHLGNSPEETPEEIRKDCCHA
jgi:predicted transcriptional regulator